MAEDITLRIDAILNAEGTKSLKDLKKDFSDLNKILSETKSGTAEYQRALEALGKTKDDIGDLRDQIGALNPEGKVAAFSNLTSKLAGGFAAAQGAAALLGGESEELQKTMIKLQAVMAFQQGIKEVAGLGDAFKTLNVVMRANPAVALAAAIAALTAGAIALYGALNNSTAASDALQEELDELKKSNEALNASINNQITALSGLEANEQKILDLKKKSLLASIEERKLALAVAIAKAQESEKNVTFLELASKLTGNATAAEINRRARIAEAQEESKKAITELQASLAALSKFDNEQEQKKIDKSKEAADKFEENEKKKEAAERSRIERMLELARQEAEIKIKAFEEDEALKESADAEFERAIEDSQKMADSQYDQLKANNKRRLDDETALRNAILQAERMLQDGKFQIASQGIALLGTLFGKNKAAADAFFALDKALAIGKVVVDTQREIAAYRANPTWSLLPDGGLALKTTAIAQARIKAALSIAAIAATSLQKFMGGGGGGGIPSGGGGAEGGGGGGGGGGAPAIPTPNNQTTLVNPNGTINQPGQQQPVIKAIVVETDITEKQKNVKSIQETANF